MTETENPSDARSAEALMLHAERFWSAEVENADRYSKQVRLVTTLAATLVGLILLRASTGLDSVIRAGDDFPFKLAAFCWFVLTFGLVLTLQLPSLSQARMLRQWLFGAGVMALAIMVGMGLLRMSMHSYGAHATAGVSIGLGFASLFAATNCIRVLLLPSQTPPETGSVASKYFLLSASALQHAKNVCLRGNGPLFLALTEQPVNSKCGTDL